MKLKQRLKPHVSGLLFAVILFLPGISSAASQAIRPVYQINGVPTNYHYDGSVAGIYKNGDIAVWSSSHGRYFRTSPYWVARKPRSKMPALASALWARLRGAVSSLLSAPAPRWRRFRRKLIDWQTQKAVAQLTQLRPTADFSELENAFLDFSGYRKEELIQNDTKALAFYKQTAETGTATDLYNLYIAFTTDLPGAATAPLLEAHGQ